MSRPSKFEGFEGYLWVPSPCEDCQFFAHCRRHEVACPRFHSFVTLGGRCWRTLPVELPSAQMYRRVYRNGAPIAA